jgi:hypothetical protein
MYEELSADTAATTCDPCTMGVDEINPYALIDQGPNPSLGDDELVNSFEELEEAYTDRSAWDVAVDKVLEDAADDPSGEMPVDHSAREKALSWGGIGYVEAPSLAPSWVSRYPEGYTFADDLLTEGLILMPASEAVPVRSKLECSVAVLTHIPQQRQVFSTAYMLGVLCGGVELLRLQRFNEARVVLAVLAKERHPLEPSPVPISGDPQNLEGKEVFRDDDRT